MRRILLIIVTFGAIFLYLLALATGNTSKLAEYYWWFFGINSIVLLGLIILIGRQIIHLRNRLKEREFGAKLTQKLTKLFTFVAVLPGILIVLISAQFLTGSIESWFDVRVETALDRGLALGRNALDFVLQDVMRKSKTILNEVIDRDENILPSRLEYLREQFAVKEIAVYAEDRRLVAYALDSLNSVTPSTITGQEIRKLVINRPDGSLESQDDNKLALRVLTRYRNINDDVRILVVLQNAPEKIVRDAELIETARGEYGQLLLSRKGLKDFYVLTLMMSFMLALTSALAFAFFISERLSAPLSELAAGTRAVAQGDFSRRHPVFRKDELGMLTAMFNRMTQQLEDAQSIAEENRKREEEAKNYLESILSNLSAGVIAFDADWRLRMVNTSAQNILKIDFEQFANMTFPEWVSLVPELINFVKIAYENEATAKQQWQQQLEYKRQEYAMVLLARGTPLFGAELWNGYVIVFDDITQLVSAQRDAAWGEVAKRLAHEIRNPLTPIQLSAERLAMKLSAKLGTSDADMLHRATNTIIKQVTALKGMVDAFRDYARAPKMQMDTVDINQIIKEVLTLYENLSFFQVELSRQPMKIMGDAALLRQVLHNLLQNAQHAVEETIQPLVNISSALVEGQAHIQILDNGSGFSTDILPKAFEPYVTSKKKGTGLGLAVVKKIVEEHRGTITIYNVKPHGAGVLLTLPLLEV